LAIFVTIFIAINYDIFLNIISKIRLKYLQIIILFSALLFNPIREYLSNKLLTLLDVFITLNNPSEYYLEKINNFFLILAFFSIIVFFVLFFYQRKNIEKDSSAVMNILFLSIFFILPSLLSINNNQSLINTFKYSLEKDSSYKLEKVTKEKKEEKTFMMIRYVNNNIKGHDLVIVDTTPFSSARYNFWFYTENNKRLIEQKNNNFPNYTPSDEFHFITNNPLDEKTKQNCTKQKGYDDVILLKCHQPI
jgi:hypothetical protein